MHKKENNVVGNIRKFIRFDIFGDIYFVDKSVALVTDILDEFYFRWFENGIIAIGEAA